MTIISVYRFKIFDIFNDQNVVSNLYATEDAIVQIKADILLEEWLEIDEVFLDGNGMYNPVKHV
jgi:hypothetical protein